jgi:hypothetical protein
MALPAGTTLRAAAAHAGERIVIVGALGRAIRSVSGMRKDRERILAKVNTLQHA